MENISDIKKKYRDKLDSLDLEVLIAHAIGKSREVVLTHPEYILTPNQKLRINNYIERRIKNEPVAYITKHKEFFGLDFTVTPNTLIPRPETELLVEKTLEEILTFHNQSSIINIIDVGTGSGNIIISIVDNLASNFRKNYRCKDKNKKIKFYGIDISKDALQVAKQNAKKNNLQSEIKFIESNLLEYFLKNKIYKVHHLILTANLPYLSKDIYESSMVDVKKYEPKSALISNQNGLSHYAKLISEIKKLKKYSKINSISCFIEISPEQKNEIKKIILNYFPKGKLNFKKDLSGKCRVVIIKIN